MKVFFVDWDTDYEKSMIDYLKNNIKIEIIEVSVISKYFNSICKKLVKYKISSRWFIKLYLLLKVGKIRNNDVVIFKDSQLVKYLHIIRDIDSKKILLMRNYVIFNDQQLLKEIHKTFDFIYSFDKKNCITYNFLYLNPFLPIGYKDIAPLLKGCKESSDKNKCFFWGLDKNRINEIESTANLLTQYKCIIDFNVVRDKSSNGKSSDFYIEDSVDYSNLLSKTVSSDILIDITKEDQDGLTLRVLEALFFNKKLITNNASVKKYDFYNSSQILVLNDTDPEMGIYDFLQADFKLVDKDILYRYSPDFIFSELIKKSV